MRSTVLVLLFGVLLPASISPALYDRLLRDRPRVTERASPDRPGPIAVHVTEVVSAVPVAWEDRACRVTEERRPSLSAGSTDRIEIRAGTGSLVVRGVEGGDAVRVRALLCASDVERLLDMDVGLRRVMGPDIVVETRQPDPDDALGWNDRDYARIDLVVEVPAGVATAIEHGAGTVSVIGVGPLRVKDGAGDVEALDVGGEVRIEDGSGAVRVHRVRGNVVVEGGTGALEVSEVEGALTVTGSEGEVRIRDVTGGVTVPGDVEVRLLERGAVEAGRPGEGGGA